MIEPEPVSPPDDVVTFTVTTLGETFATIPLIEPAAEPSATAVRVEEQVPSLDMYRAPQPIHIS